MYPTTTALSPEDIQTILTLCIKSLDGADQVTRISLSRLASHILPISPEQFPTTLTTLSSHFHNQRYTKRTRIGIISIYQAFLLRLGGVVVEANYGSIVRHLLVEIASPQPQSQISEQLFIKKQITNLLRLVISPLLSEQAQISSILHLSNSYLRVWPPLPSEPVPPTPLILTIVLCEVSGLLSKIGNAPPQVQDSLQDPLQILLAHPSLSVRVHTAWCLRTFSFACPRIVAGLIVGLEEKLRRDINLLASPEQNNNTIRARILGNAYAVSTLTSILPSLPLSLPPESTTQSLLSISRHLLKSAADHPLPIAEVEVEVAWATISGLREAVGGLLVLWRNALPKPLARDTGGGRTEHEWEFLKHVRECAVGSILCFLQSNARSRNMLTLDVERRISTLLTNALLFVTSYEEFRSSVASPPSTHTQTYSVALLQSRIFQSFLLLGFATLPDSTQAMLLSSCISLFAGSEASLGISTVQASIAAAQGYTGYGGASGVWSAGDGYAFGVSSLDVIPADEGIESKTFDIVEDLVSLRNILHKAY